MKNVFDFFSISDGRRIRSPDAELDLQMLPQSDTDAELDPQMLPQLLFMGVELLKSRCRVKAVSKGLQIRSILDQCLRNKGLKGIGGCASISRILKELVPRLLQLLRVDCCCYCRVGNGDDVAAEETLWLSRG